MSGCDVSELRVDIARFKKMLADIGKPYDQLGWMKLVIYRVLLLRAERKLDRLLNHDRRVADVQPAEVNLSGECTHP